MSILAYEFYKAVKSQCQCLICSTRSDLTFHHVNPALKRETVSNIARYGTVDDLTKEINKCVPLCVDCHRKVHTGYHNGWLKGKFNNGLPSQDWKAREHMPLLKTTLLFSGMYTKI